MDVLGVRDWLKGALGGAVWVGAHKMDLGRERAVCVYRRKGFARRTIGGASGFGILPLTVLVRGGLNAAAAVAFAGEVYEKLGGGGLPGGLGTFCLMGSDAAIALGTDEKGVYEFSLDCELYYPIGQLLSKPV